MNVWGWLVLICLVVGVFVVASFLLEHLVGLIALAVAVVVAYYFYRNLKKNPTGAAGKMLSKRKASRTQEEDAEEYVE